MLEYAAAVVRGGGGWMDGVRAAGVEPAAALGRSVVRRARARRREGLASRSGRRGFDQARARQLRADVGSGRAAGVAHARARWRWGRSTHPSAWA